MRRSIFDFFQFKKNTILYIRITNYYWVCFLFRMNIVIKVENLSKQYRLGLVGSGTFKEDVHRVWTRLRGLHDPYLFQGEEDHPIPNYHGP